MIHDERYVLAISEGHRAVRLRDQKTGEIHEFDSAHPLYDALGVLAEWRERDAADVSECPGCGGQLTAHGFHSNGMTRCTVTPQHKSDSGVARMA